MGVVYLATDTRLDRAVAIKALPAHLAESADRLSRFQREAKLLASLNHPNVAAIYGIEELDGHRFLVLELVEGETLSDRLKRGPIPVHEALRLAAQIAEALEAAHEKGIIHRDLKPGNVMETPEGKVKVLDFGLARTADGVPSSSGINAARPDSPTITTPHPAHSPTIAGVIMGTAGYMSPEQARGKPVDKRSDIFSFGCVLYEMLAGSGPFPGETVTDSLGAIVHKDPDWELLPAGVPHRVRELLAGCLAKDRTRRLRDIGDARLELERALSGKDLGTEDAGTKSRWAPSLAGAVLVTALIAASGAWIVASRRVVPATTNTEPNLRLVIPSRTDAYSQAQHPVIAPDGRSVAFVAKNLARNAFSLWVRPLDSFESRPIPETDGASNVFWSPDSQSIAFHADSKLWATEIAGGSRRLLATLPGNYGAHWAPDGSILITSISGESHVLRVTNSSGVPEQLTTIDPKSTEKVHCWPRMLPDRQHYLYVGVDFDPNSEVRIGRLYAGRLGSTERSLVGNIISQAWYADAGRLVFVEDGAIKSVPFDLASLKITGDATTIADGAFFFKEYGYSSLSAADNGTIAFTAPEEDHFLVWFDSEGRRVGTLGSKGLYDAPRISRDGSQVALAVVNRRTGVSDLWLYGVNRPTATRITTDAREETRPVWSPDGSRLFFSWDRSEAPRVYTLRSDGSGPIDEVYGEGSDGGVWYADDVSPDGSTLIVSGNVPKLSRELRLVPLKSKGETVPFMSSPANEGNARFSPKGDHVVFISTSSGRREVYITPFPGPGPKIQISDGGGWNPVWSAAGDRVFYLKDIDADPSRHSPASRAIMTVDLESAAAFKSPPKPRLVFETTEVISEFDIAPDGKRFLAIVNSPDTPPIRIIQNAVASPGSRTRR